MSDEPRDRRLQEALRHAPDADAAPPPALRAAILREAREAVAPPPRRGGLAALWDAMASPRFAAAFASLAVLTVAGMLWWNRPMEEFALPPAAPVRVAPSAAPALPAAPAEAPRDLAKMQAPAPAAETPAPRREREARRADATVAKPPAAPSPPRAEAPPSPAVSPPAVAESTANQAEAEQRKEAAPAAPPAAAPAPAPAPAAAPATTPATMPAAAAPTTAAPARAGRLAGATADAMRPAPPDRWDRGDGRIRPADPRLLAFVERLETAIAPGAGASIEAASASAPAEGVVLRLYRGERLLRTLRITGDTLAVEAGSGGPVVRRPLPPGQGAVFAAELESLSR